MTKRTDPKSLDFHLKKILSNERRFENVYQSLTRMFRDFGHSRVTALGKDVYDFAVFRQGNRHLIGLSHEINSFVTFVQSAAEGGDSAKLAFVLEGEPGNAKTFFVDYLQEAYREFLEEDTNSRFTFKFKNLDKLGGYGQLNEISSQTFEDPMILAMNLFGFSKKKREIAKEYLAAKGFDESEVERMFDIYRPLGACSSYALRKIREHTDGNIESMLDFVDIVPVELSPSEGTVTSVLHAKDKVSATAFDLVGGQDVVRILQLSDQNNPYKINVGAGALARSGGGGIHFVDELFKFNDDLIKVYLGLIQNREIEVMSYKWFLDTCIIATTNYTELMNFKDNDENQPVIDRCRFINVPHNTDVLLQNKLTEYAKGKGKKTTFGGDPLHYDPNLNIAANTAAVLTRLPLNEKISRGDMLLLTSGRGTERNGIGKLRELYEEMDRNPDASKRFGRRGVGHRGIVKALDMQRESIATQEGKCMYAADFFDALEQTIIDSVSNAADRKKYLDDIAFSRFEHKKSVKVALFNAYMEDEDAIEKRVMQYVNQIVAIGSDEVSWGEDMVYHDPQTGNVASIRLDKRFVDSVEARMGLKNKEAKDTYRQQVKDMYAREVQKIEPKFNFMEQERLVRAVTEVTLESDINQQGNLIGALTNPENEENRKLRTKLENVMINKLGYCHTCAAKSIEYYCTKEDES
jgi:serine protein kinase